VFANFVNVKSKAVLWSAYAKVLSDQTGDRALRIVEWTWIRTETRWKKILRGVVLFNAPLVFV